jgi:hypothetical protein
MTTGFEIEALRRSEAHQAARMAEVDVLARSLAHLPFTTMVTPQMPAGTWAIGRRVDDNEVRFVREPECGLPRGVKPPLGHVLIVALDVAARMAGGI